MRQFFEPGTPLALHNGVVIPAGNDVLKGVIDQIVFFCTLKKHDRPILATERTGILSLVWSGIPPIELSNSGCSELVINADHYSDVWTIQESLSLADFLDNYGGRII